MESISNFPSRKFKNSKSCRRNRGGQAVVEYVLLLAIAAAISMSFVGAFSALMDQGILTFNAVLEADLRTGSFQNPSPLDPWEN